MEILCRFNVLSMSFRKVSYERLEILKNTLDGRNRNAVFFSIAFIRVDEHSANQILKIHQGHLK